VGYGAMTIDEKMRIILMWVHSFRVYQANDNGLFYGRLVTRENRWPEHMGPYEDAEKTTQSIYECVSEMIWDSVK
jgi:hypothetical protein